MVDKLVFSLDEIKRRDNVYMDLNLYEQGDSKYGWADFIKSMLEDFEDFTANVVNDCIQFVSKIFNISSPIEDSDNFKLTLKYILTGLKCESASTGFVDYIENLGLYIDDSSSIIKSRSLNLV